MREREIEDYLHQQVERFGGTTRKFVSPGRRGVPDRIVIWPRVRGTVTCYYEADIHFVEVKAPKKKPRPEQKREHARLEALGCKVVVIDTKGQVNLYVRAHRQ